MKTKYEEFQEICSLQLKILVREKCTTSTGLFDVGFATRKEINDVIEAKEIYRIGIIVPHSLLMFCPALANEKDRLYYTECVDTLCYNLDTDFISRISALNKLYFKVHEIYCRIDGKNKLIICIEDKEQEESNEVVDKSDTNN